VYYGWSHFYGLPQSKRERGQNIYVGNARSASHVTVVGMCHKIQTQFCDN